MRLRVAIGSVLAILVSAIAISTAALKAPGKRPARQIGDLYLPITAHQLPPENGVVPVELKCEKAELSTPNTIKKLSCVIKNNATKYIAAVTLNIFVTLEKEGKTSTDSSFLTIDTFVHPDFRGEHENNLIPPKGERPFQDLPTTYDGAVIKGLAVSVDYVEFKDNSTAGPNRSGSRIIIDIREGAAKYKRWLVQKYHQGGKSINAILPLLEKDQPIPYESGIQNGDQQQGAIFYRNYARKTYQAKGAGGLTKHLEHSNTTVNK
ncbi:MAG TPA: hypothetical protein VJT09_01575 [Pyrinomonadaceae bacterium]|nr:hypothetical protein [Pyrinomonadaceae bacterium]